MSARGARRFDGYVCPATGSPAVVRQIPQAIGKESCDVDDLE